MSVFLVGGQFVDPILLLLAIEFIVLSAWLRRIAWRDLAFNLLAGACLLLALRQALTGASFANIALCLLAGLVFHIGDIAQRIGFYPRPINSRISN